MVNREDPRVLRTIKLIRDAFRELVRREDFDSVTVKDIARKATINRATFYAHYEDKYELLDEITERFFQERVPEQVTMAQEFTDEICSGLVLLTHRYIVDFHRICRMDAKSIAKLVDDKVKRMLQQIIEGILLQGDEGYADERRRTRMIAAMTASAIYSAANAWFLLGEEERTDPLVDVVRPYIMNGLGL